MFDAQDRIVFEGIAGTVKEVTGTSVLVQMDDGKEVSLPACMLEHAPAGFSPSASTGKAQAPQAPQATEVCWEKNEQLATAVGEQHGSPVRAGEAIACGLVRHAADLFKALASTEKVAEYRSLKDTGKRDEAYALAFQWVLTNLYKSL